MYIHYTYILIEYSFFASQIKIRVYEPKPSYCIISHIVLTIEPVIFELWIWILSDYILVRGEVFKERF